MDHLHERLNQHLEQWPPLEAPFDPDNPLVLSVEESRRRVDDALLQAEEGDISGALQALSVDRCHPDVVDAWNMAWLELQALRFETHDVDPLAARFSAAVLQQHSRSGANATRQALIARRAWAWKYEGATPALLLPLRGELEQGSGPPPSLFLIQGYTNSVEPPQGESRQPFQHFHFAMFRTSTMRYVASYAVLSQDLLGTGNVCFLELQTQNEPEVLRVYDTVPDYSAALADVKKHLEQPTTGGGAS